MDDEYVLRKGNEICVLDGNRAESQRRGDSRRVGWPPGVFAVNAINRRNQFERRLENDRRIPETVTDLECSIERGSSVIVGGCLLVLAVFSMVLGLTFLPLIGYIAGIILGIAGVSCIFAPTRPGCGFLLKKDVD